MIVQSKRELASSLRIYGLFQGTEYCALVLCNGEIFELASRPAGSEANFRRVAQGCDRWLRVQEAMVDTDEVQEWIRRVS